MTSAQHQHRMIIQAIMANARKLRSRKRNDIAQRPETKARLEELRAEEAALLASIRAA